MGLKVFVDIVLNHTANNSKWIAEHPSATYNTVDCPHLNSAYLLDKALSDFSNLYSEKKVPECPNAPYIRNEQDLKDVMNIIKAKVIKPLGLHEFFLCQNPSVVHLEEIDESIYEEYKVKFEKLGWFMMPKFELIRDHLTKGHGSERFGV
jgi:hypothetical protein